MLIRTHCCWEFYTILQSSELNLERRCPVRLTECFAQQGCCWPISQAWPLSLNLPRAKIRAQEETHTPSMLHLNPEKTGLALFHLCPKTGMGPYTQENVSPSNVRMAFTFLSISRACGQYKSTPSGPFLCPGKYYQNIQRHLTPMSRLLCTVSGRRPSNGP